MHTLKNEIEKAYHKLIQVAAEIPSSMAHQKEIEAAGGKVSVIDLIAYQIGWGKLLLSWYEAGKEGKMPQMPGEGFTSWEYVKIARHFYEKYHSDDLKKAIEQFSLVVTQILQMVEEEGRKGNLEKTGVWSWCTLRSEKKWPLSKWVTVNTVSPYKKATSLIKKFLVEANQLPPKGSNG